MTVGRVRACVVTGYGINADEELLLALRMAGAQPARVHVRELMDQPRLLARSRILAFPGGFSFGDHLGSGKVFATMLRRGLSTGLRDFVQDGGLVLGVCNGFQVLVKLGILPNLSGSGDQEVSLIHNDSGKFEDRWVRLEFPATCASPWTRGLPALDVPVRHGEGKFVTRTPQVLAELESRGLIAARYVAPGGYPENPNGSLGNIAGICDATGRIFGLMPHPEAFLFPENHPEWGSRAAARPAPRVAIWPAGDGLRLFQNGVQAASGR